MGFKFLKELGEKLADAGISSAEDMAGALADKVRELELDIDKLDVSYDDGKATIRGLAADDETREKAILAVGNHVGVSEVEDEITVGVTAKEKEEADARREAARARARRLRTDALRRRAAAKKKAAEEEEEEDDTQEGITSVFYTVKRGDTLSEIALAHYDDASKYPVIFDANRPMLKDPDLIYPGQVLRIPPLD